MSTGPGAMAALFGCMGR